MNYCKKSPCKNCPYRKDAPRALWSVDEFKDLKQKDATMFGSVYGCHKNDGNVCVGWLMNQDNRGLPSLYLRMDLSRNKVGRKYMDALKSKSEMFDTIDEMCHANFPNEF